MTEKEREAEYRRSLIEYTDRLIDHFSKSFADIRMGKPPRRTDATKEKLIKDLLRYNSAHHNELMAQYAAQFIPAKDDDDERFKKAKDITP